jgi:methylated-DNA-protein-cysteine methyltransferase-like protein
MVSSKYSRIYEVVRGIPEGRVATYGQIAALAGLPGQPRLVGYALHNCPPEEDVPWQRVINARGEVSARSSAEGAENLQRVMLEAEGVEFNARGRIDLERSRWDPPPGSMGG